MFIILLLANSRVFAQSKTIVGVVTDESKQTIPGVSISVKGTKSTAQTDDQGRYRIQALPTDQLIFNYIGYVGQTITVGAKTTINVSLISSVTGLDDVVVIGYGTTKRADLTGAVGSVNMKDFEQAPVKSFDQALAGRVAGVQVSTNNGQPGATANIVIRGAGSISQSNSPLYVIDGFPSESANANSINTSDIESIDILKDASATAIYGARGSNGVVLITTKKGKMGKPQLSYNAYYGTQQAPAKIPLMNAFEFVKYVKELNSSYADTIYLKDGVTLDDYKNVASIDMQDYVFQNGQNQNHDIALRGGNDKTTYSISGNFNNQKGIVIESGFKRYQGRFVLDQTITDKLKAGVNVNYAYTETFGTPVSPNSFWASTALYYAVWGYRPAAALSGRDENTNILDSFYDPTNDLANNQDYRVNPLISLQNQKTLYKATAMVANGYAEYAFTPKLKLRIAGGFTNTNTETNIFNNSLTQSGSKWNATGPNGTFATSPNFNWLNDNTLTYRNTFNSDHNLTALVGYSSQGNRNSYRSIYATQVTNESLGIDALDLVPASNSSVTSRSSRWMLQSFLGRVNYDFKGKYLLTASFRADGSSKFAPGNRWGYFPSASAGWRFSQEKFMKNVTWLSDGKIRVGYGASGNNRVDDFAYLPSINLADIQYWYSFNGQPVAIGSVITAGGNTDLKWETNLQTNIGLDLSFFKNKLGLTLDVYKRVTNDLLLNAQLPYASGIQRATGFKNIGSLENRGLEISLNSTNIQTKNFRWTSNFNISFNQNKIVELTEGQNSLLSGSGTFFNTNYSSLSPYISVKGRPVGEMYGLIFDGIYQYADFDKMPNGAYVLKPNITTNGATRASIRPGDIKYKDLNGDLVVNNNDYTIIGRGLPIHTGGFSNNFTYRNWDLGVFLQWSYGNNIINANRYVFEGGIVYNPNLNQYASFQNRWSPTNPSNTIYRAGGMVSGNYSSRVVEDGSYLRLKTLQLGYNFSKKILSKIGMSKLRLNASAQNLLTFTGYSGPDPESSSRPGNLTPGFDFANYPQSFTVTFGLNATF
ncbi:SusC/RagA family TonB-linked outer membrane protein [Pedobacter endophyticus]|uniref:SusC/RagA family TonB-linked outer membrane protein n=1 Tax=Pedobacter endophyticus TaxID=2789740 RepID=UPI001E54E6B0|nr:TonB-dependent receptor [Pedobacter endophyticus]